MTPNSGMYMREWVQKLDDFIKLNEREILTHAGKITNQKAKDKANLEYDKFRALTSSAPSLVERHFLEAVEKTKKLEGGIKLENSKGKDR